MKKIVKKLILLFIIMILILVTKTYAAGSFSISSSKTTINKGESVTLSIKGNNAYGEINITATNAKVSLSSVFLQNDTKTVTVTSTSSEDIKVTVSPASSGLGDIDENPITGSQSITIKVNGTSNSGGNNSNSGGTSNNGGSNTSAPQTKSNNANVKMIETSPVDFTGFKANKTSGYEVTVENNVDRINVNVSKEDSKSSVSLLNKTNSDTGKSWVYIAEGNNEIDVTVTAENGTTKKTYTINVTRKAKEEQPQEEPEQPEEETPEEPMEEIFGLSELKIEGLELNPQFQTDIYEYKIDLNDDLEKLNVTTLATEANSNIEILGNEDLKEGENVITILVKGENEEKTATYQIIVNKTMPIIENNKNMEQDHQQMIKKIIVVSAAGGVILIIIIVSIIVKIKKSKNLSNEYIPYENVLDNYEENEIEEQNDDDEFFEEETKKKKRSKGKRFK